MKNKKFKLFASLTSLVMVVAVMAVGVWAATSASVGVTGTATFDVVGIAATVTNTANSDAEPTGANNDTILSVGLSETGKNGTWTFNFEFVAGDATNGLLNDKTKIVQFTIAETAGSAPAYFQVATTALGSTQDAAAVISITDIAIGDAANGQASTAAVTGEVDSTTITITYTVSGHTGVALDGENAVVQGFSITLNNTGTFN